MCVCVYVCVRACVCGCVHAGGLRGVSGRAGGLVWRRRDLGPQSPAHRGNVVVVAVSEEASAGGGLLGRPPLMPASQAESGDGKHRGS